MMVGSHLLAVPTFVRLSNSWEQGEREVTSTLWVPGGRRFGRGWATIGNAKREKTPTVANPAFHPG